MPNSKYELDVEGGDTNLGGNLTVTGNTTLQATLAEGPLRVGNSSSSTASSLWVNPNPQPGTFSTYINFGATVTGGMTVDNLSVTGSLNKPEGSFKIDHPLDPEHKYLYHSFVESPDMKNIYDGTVALDAKGRAWVDLPKWFQALNSDFRYQLTCIGGYAPVYIAQEINANRFQIAGGKAGLKVSCQVTGVRRDAFAEKHRIQVEEEKAAAEQGYYLHPDAYGLPPERGIAWAKAHPGAPQPGSSTQGQAAPATELERSAR